MCSAMVSIKDAVFLNFGFPEMITTTFSAKRNVKIIAGAEVRFKQHYRKHNNHVINTVPKNDLLIWNVKVNSNNY